MEKAPPINTHKSRDQPLSHNEWRKLPKLTPKWEIDILCDRMQTTENAGHIIRTSAGLGVSNIYFLRPKFKWNTKKLLKLSRATTRAAQIEQIQRIAEVDISAYKHVVGLEYSRKSKSIYDHKVNGKMLLILGSEFDGIQEELLNLAGEVYHIPLVGEQSSINVAQACSGALVHINKTRLALG